MSETTETTPTLAEILAPEGTGTFNGVPEAVAEQTATVQKTVVDTLRQAVKAANLWRTLAVLVIGFRSNVEVSYDATGAVGPDWEARSDLAKRWTSFAITGPITKANAKGQFGVPTKDLVLQVQKGIENVLGRKVPGSDSSLTLRETLILDWVTKNHPEATEEERLALMREQFANLGRKTSAQKIAERQAKPDNPAGPGTTKAAAPTVALTEAVDRILTAKEDSAVLVLVTEAVRIMQRAGRQLVTSDQPDNIADRPEVGTALATLTETLALVQARFDGEADSIPNLRMYLNLPVESDVVTGAEEPSEEEPSEAPTEEAAKAPRKTKTAAKAAA